MSYASIASRNVESRPAVNETQNRTVPQDTGPSTTKDARTKRSPSPSHVPKTDSPESSVYILTLLTDKAHHKRMTDRRNKYFPKKLNKLAAHLTLFHALPGSQLEGSIIPVIQKVASETMAFKIHASRPFKLRRGIAISVPNHEGGSQAQDVHRMLQRAWAAEGFLSEQDAGGFRCHCTIMNKVDDERVVEAAWEEVGREWKGDWGVVEGLGLWRYEKGWWKWQRGFEFGAEPEGGK